MSATKEETLSPDELRKRLYQTFKNKGVLDTLKTQLRNQLIQELKHPPVTGVEPVPRPVSVRAEPLVVTACNSIVADHLRTSGYEYTLSVFYPETGLCQEKSFSREDLLQFLKLSPASDIYTSLISNKGSDKGFLISLLTHLMHHHTRNHCCDADTQTMSSASYGESLVDKMKMIDKEYENLSFINDKWLPLESKMAAHRKEIEEQVQAEMNTQLQHFKDMEIAKVKMEEKSNFHKEFDKMKKELERTYEMKTKALMEREKNAIDRLQKQQEIEEKNLYVQRQSALKELETHRSREHELKIRMESFDKTCQIQEEKLKMTEELLRKREMAVKTLEDTYDQRLKNELSRYQYELKEEYLKRTEKLTENESRNKSETARIQRESSELDSKLEEHSRALSELRRLQAELETAQQQISLVTEQREMLRERVENMSDYSSLKREKAEVQGQLQLLSKQLEEAQEEMRLLHADLGRPSKEQLSLQMELQRLRSSRTLEAQEFDNQKQVLQAQLQSEVERSSLLKAQLLECQQKAQWMANQLEDVRAQLHQTHSALEIEVLRNPKPFLADRSVLDFHADKLLPPDIYVDRPLLRARAGYDDVCEAGGPLRGPRSRWTGSPDPDLQLVAEAKARFEELQREAEMLEEAYRNYQQRAVCSTLSHTFHPRPLSPQLPSHGPRSPPPRQQVSHPKPSNTLKVSHRPSATKTLQSSVFTTADTRNTLPPRVTVSEALVQPRSTLFPEHRRPPLMEPVILSNGQNKSSAPLRPPSSTPRPSPRKKSQKETVEEPSESPVPFPDLSSDGQLPCAPREEKVTSGDSSSSSELSSPRSPLLKSTARDQPSPPKAPLVLTSSESSPQPEKIHLEDLAGSSSEPGHIPQLLLDTAVPLSEEAPDGPAVPRPQDLPEDPRDSQGPAEVPQSAGDVPLRGEDEEEEEDEEQKWERERKERQERRQREQEEARERELRELERLEKEMLSQEKEVKEEEEEEGEIENERDEEQKDEVEASRLENPLEKYMKMVLEDREKQQKESPRKAESGPTSPEARSLSEEREDSIAASFSHKEEEDEFW